MLTLAARFHFSPRAAAMPLIITVALPISTSSCGKAFSCFNGEPLCRVCRTHACRTKKRYTHGDQGRGRGGEEYRGRREEGGEGGREMVNSSSNELCWYIQYLQHRTGIRRRQIFSSINRVQLKRSSSHTPTPQRRSTHLRASFAVKKTFLWVCIVHTNRFYFLHLTLSRHPQLPVGSPLFSNA